MTSIALTTSNVHGMSVLAFAAVGARSHQFCVLRIGQALAARGHNFTLLISDQDDLGLDKLGSTALVGLDLVTFRGPPFVGTDLWNQQRSRDLLEVCQCSTMAIFDCELCEAKDMNPLAGLHARHQPAGRDAGNGACLVCRQGHPSEATCCRYNQTFRNADNNQTHQVCSPKATTVTSSAQSLPRE